MELTMDAKKDLLWLIGELEKVRDSFSYGFRYNSYGRDEDTICAFCTKRYSEDPHDEDCQWEQMNTNIQTLKRKYEELKDKS
jgi:hypothetical protein